MFRCYSPNTSSRRPDWRFWLLSAAIVAVLPVAPALAQDTEVNQTDVQRFDPATSQSTDFFAEPSARVLNGGDWEFGVVADYANDPLASETGGSVVSGLYTLNILAAVGIADWFEFGVSVPTIVRQETEIVDKATGSLPDSPTPSFGDVRLVPQLQIFSTESEFDPGGVTMSVIADTYLPTGDETQLQGDGFRAEPRLALDVASTGGTRVGTNVGFMTEAQSSDQADEDTTRSVTWGVGASFPFFASELRLVPEISTEIPVGAGSDVNDMAIDGMLGGKVTAGNLLLEAGGGAGLDENLGAPDWRAFAGVTYAMAADTDIDADGILDEVDACPQEPEDADGWLDADGCIDPDNDEDQVADAADQCPEEAEDADGWRDQDGCPDSDNDFDNVADLLDSCPRDAEDVDSFEDADGCPELDNDGDGIPDEVDGCANVAENMNDYEDLDGCPDEGEMTAMITPCERINISDQIHFEVDSANIEPGSYWVLDEVAEVMAEHPDISEVRIEGHTDATGSSDYNQDLSQRRAQSIMQYLTTSGDVDHSRLQAVGFGETEPISTNESDSGRAENRRVEFDIVEQEGCDD